MLLSLVLLSFTKNLRVNAKLERAYLEKIKEGYNLRGACLIAYRKLPAAKVTQEGEKPVQEGQEGPQGETVPQGMETGAEGAPPLGEGGMPGMEGKVTEEGPFPVKEKEMGQGQKVPPTEGTSEEEGDKKEYWKPRPQPYSLELKGKEYSVFIEDEGGKLNVNALKEKHKDVFQRLLEVRGISQQEAEVITDCLIDWLDEDNMPLPRGAEGKYYESLPEPYSCRNGQLESLEELTLVKGITPEVYEKIEKDLTIYGQDLKIGINSASREVVHAVLDLDLREAEGVVEFVKGKKGLKTLDDLKDVFFKFGVAGKDFEKARELMTTDISPYLSVRSKGSTGRQYRLVVDKSRESILAVYPE